jgi:hypothetical protein
MAKTQKWVDLLYLNLGESYPQTTWVVIPTGWLGPKRNVLADYLGRLLEEASENQDVPSKLARSERS